MSPITMRCLVVLHKFLILLKLRYNRKRGDELAFFNFYDLSYYFLGNNISLPGILEALFELRTSSSDPEVREYVDKVLVARKYAVAIMATTGEESDYLESIMHELCSAPHVQVIMMIKIMSKMGRNAKKFIPLLTLVALQSSPELAREATLAIKLIEEES